MKQDLYVAESKIAGKGVFTKKAFKKGKTVFIFKGKIVNWVVRDKKTSLYKPNWIGIEKNKWMDVLSPGIYTNHSCEPNSGIRGKVKVTALRDIKKGEEITIDYSITEMEELWCMRCKCGTKNCRHLIRSIQFLPKNIYNKYAPYIPVYFTKVYEKSHSIK